MYLFCWNALLVDVLAEGEDVPWKLLLARSQQRTFDPVKRHECCFDCRVASMGRCQVEYAAQAERS